MTISYSDPEDNLVILAPLKNMKSVMSSLLILDASSTLCSVALNIDGETMWLTEDQPRRHAQRLLPMVD